ncbi:Acyl-CoA synthetase (AMP-forming)/AMP-acid ligase II [Pseudonocardia ammonioxydans]|uniref:Acyl-CoA synthetase (AMP-forming)/AMP-acid ligase II n=1 Tax=Pseudonocardia ammonioxydans TaxID=260086 RepID=A0A1I5HIN2_PSUAM|nr:long-chain fatty acid--CoA ligase [Pseudonocardia ammonioxydans]SFO48132.1 Acyl-CoA synthetase (AMP-forming)/AMP-acid ligase II [Pseudonocardia ammonioxydans]
MYLTQGLHRAVQQQPDAVATVCGERTRTFTETAERVARLAGALRGLGVASGDRVAMLSLNSDRFHEFLLAVPWADAVLNPINVRWSPAEIVYSLKDSGTRVLIVDDTFAPILPSLRPHLDVVIHAGNGPAPDGALSFEELIAGAEPVEDARRGGDELAGLFYTGGTTGNPKGVMLSHTNLMTSAFGFNATGYLFGPGCRYLHAAPMFHLADLAAWSAATAAGGTHVIVPAFEPAAILAAITRHQVTDTLLVPTMIQLLIDHPTVGEHDLTSLRSVVYGASPIAQSTLERAMKTLPNASFTQAYGMTELSPLAALLSPDDHRRTDLLRAAGRAAQNSEIRIVDPEDREVPRGTVGEIVCRGGNVMRGYWGLPEETATTLRGGWMHTGDGGYMDDQGYVFVVDRIKDMIVTGGENVYSAEVENALATHSGVASCAVIGVPDDEWGERVHAVVVAAPGHTPGAEELREHVKSLIAGYKAPRSVELADALPVSGAGKILKRELRRRYWADAERQVL